MAAKDAPIPVGPHQFPERFKALRTRIGKSQRQLAILCEHQPSERTIRAWEKGETDPRLGKALERAAEVLDVTPGFLRWGEEW